MAINKQEAKYIFLSTIFGVVWFLLIMPKLMSMNVENTSPYLQFALFNLGIFIILQLFFKAITLNRTLRWKESFGLTSLLIALDIILPPFSVNYQGNLLTGPILAASSSDYVAGFFGNSVGIHGYALFIFVYIVVPFIFLSIAAKLLNNFVRSL